MLGGAGTTAGLASSGWAAKEGLGGWVRSELSPPLVVAPEACFVVHDSDRDRAGATLVPLGE